ncbi:MAG: isopeptide-forming domain-containing fimbrial protein [Eggerthellaceae bacterium]|nr:isopeptide-forming domain-containing fimbrial protein [Eggerthellaceae bacterium]
MLDVRGHNASGMLSAHCARHGSRLFGAQRTRNAPSALLLGGGANVLRAMLLVLVGVAIASVVCTFSPVTAFAQDGQLTIASPDGTERSYHAYRLMAGQVEKGSIQNATTQGCVPVSVWEAVGAPSTQVEELAAWLSSRLAADAESSFAIALRDAIYASGAAPAATFKTGQMSALPEGYYLVASGAARPLAVLVDAQAPANVTEKSTTPTVKKEVLEPSTGEWGSAAALGVGKPVSFRVTGTLPSDLSAYRSYTYWFLDTPGNGLSIDVGTVVAEVLHADGTTTAIDLEVVQDGGSLRMGSNDIKNILPTLAATDRIIVEYTANVTSEALRDGLVENSVELVYTNRPDQGEEGRTVPSIVHMYSFALDVAKVEAGTATALSGAQFTLQNEAGDYLAAGGAWTNAADADCVFTTNADGRAVLDGLGAGSYTLTEVAAPKGYDPLAAPLTVTIVPGPIADDGTLESFTATITGAGARVIGVDATRMVAYVTVEDPKQNTPHSEEPGKSDESGKSSTPGDNTPDTPASATPTSGNPASKENTPSAGTPGTTTTTRTGGVLTGDSLTDILLIVGIAVAAGTLAAFATTRKKRKDEGPSGG